MKKIVALLLAIVMVMTSITVLAEDVGAAAPQEQPAQAEEAALPQVGDVVHGFEVKEVTNFPLINADVVYFVHQATGGELLYLANEDTNRVFELTFKTPTHNDMGVPHVFEHATLGGSEKYPSKELFFNLGYQTYNTYMNAATYSHMTTYPVASLSEEQLYKYADFYTDSCFNPSVKTDESIFTEEAWRYSMASAESDLTIAGTVYSEMQGAWTIQSAAQKYFIRTLFPGANVGNVSGGIPSQVPLMSWQDVKDYHDSYYHPSNSLACLYGKFENYERFLELLNAYYAPYSREEIFVGNGNYVPVEASAEAVYEFPMTANANTDKAAEIWYGFRVDTDDVDTINALDLLTTLLGFDSFPVIEKLKEALPAASCSAGLLLDTPTPAVVFYASGVDAADAETFKTTIDAALQEILANGFDQEAVDSVVAAFNMDIRLMPESSSLGVDMLPNIAYYWASFGDWHGYLDFIASIDKFGQWNEDGTFLRVLEQYLINNEFSALVTTVPAPGKTEEESAALAAKLAETKAGMTAEEIDAIVATTKALEEGATGDAAQYVAQLQAVTVESLPEELRTYDYTDVTGEDGVRRINVDANVDGVGQAMLLLNVADLPQDYLHWFQLYTDLLCEVDTKTHTRAELASLATRYLYDGVIKVSMPYDDRTDLHIRAAWKATDEDQQAAYDLVWELLFDSKFTDGQRIAEVVSNLKNSKKQELNNNLYMSQLYRAMRISDTTQNLYQYMTDIDYYLFLEELDAALAQDPTVARRPLQTVQVLVNNGTGAITGFAGSKESQAVNQPIADAFVAKLNKRAVSPTKFDIPVPARKEGIVAETTVQYNLLYATYEELGMEEYAGELDAVTALVSDAFLLPLLRDQYGAYSVLHGAVADGGVYLLTYRDPNVQQTYDVYAQLSDLLANYTVDQESLDGYILSSYAYYAQPAGELAGAESAILNVISGTPQDELLDVMKSLKAVKAEDLAKYADMYAKMVANGVRSTVGSKGTIEENAALFEAVIDPFQAVDRSSVGFADCAEDHPLYQSVRFVYDNGLMLAASDEAFGVDEPATLGDFAAACYVLVGGPLDGAEGIAFLNQYQVISNEPVDTVLSRGDLGVAMGNFMYCVGLQTSGTADVAAYTDGANVPSANVSDFACMIDNGMFVPASADTLDLESPATRGMLANMLNIFYNVVLAGQ